LLTRSVERLAVSVHAEKEDEYGKECYGPDFAAEVFETHAFKHDATGDSQKMGNGEYLADHLRPSWHAPEGKEVEITDAAFCKNKL